MALCGNCEKLFDFLQGKTIEPLTFNYGPYMLRVVCAHGYECPICLLVLKHIGIGIDDAKPGSHLYRSLHLPAELILSGVRCQKDSPDDSFDTFLEIRLDGMCYGLIRILQPSTFRHVRQYHSVIHKELDLDGCIQLIKQPDQQIIFPFLKKSIEDCEDGDHILCRPILHNQPDVDDTLDILLIDVDEMRLINAQTSYRYCALSYVWGDVSMYRTELHNLSTLLKALGLNTIYNQLPLAIQDAITLVRSLGQRYLWIDSLCIVQDDDHQKHDNIRNMNIIYGHALLTIALITGYDANKHLPGVNPNTRLPQSFIRVNDIPIFISGPSLDQALLHSEYETRGWTFQERMLSIRCLFIAEKEIYFTCKLGIERECEPQPITQYTRTEANMIVQQLHPLSPLFASSLNSPPPMLPGYLRLPPIYYQLVDIYSGRHLSFQADRVNAFAGILAIFANLKGWPSVHGLLIIRFTDALLWSVVHKCPVTRGRPSLDPNRPNRTFPSWSWANHDDQVVWASWIRLIDGYALRHRKTLVSSYTLHGPGTSQTIQLSTQGSDEPPEFFTFEVSQASVGFDALQCKQLQFTAPCINIDKLILGHAHNQDGFYVMLRNINHDPVFGVLDFDTSSYHDPTRNHDGKVFEMVGISTVPAVCAAGEMQKFEWHFDEYHGPILNFLIVEWIDGIAYRRGIGHVGEQDWNDLGPIDKVVYLE